MKCIQCENDARAICRFCGRAVRESHIQTKEFHAGYGKSKKSHALDRGSETAVTIADAVWCGVVSATSIRKRLTKKTT